jgi:hypothetical protein
MSEEQITEQPIENLEQPTSTEGTHTEQPDGNSGQTAVEEQQGKRNDNTVPYQRFKEVNEAKKELEAKLAQAAQVFNPAEDVKNTETNLEPKREQFASDAEYYKELGLWSGRQGFQEAKTQEEQQSREYQEVQRKLSAQKNFAEKADEASKKYNNYKEALASSTVEFTEDVSLAIQASPVAGDLAYALATNPTEAARIASLPTNEALYALGTLSAQIPGSNGQPTKMSNMPNPINPVGTGKPSATKSYSDDMDQSSFNDSFPFEELE